MLMSVSLSRLDTQMTDQKLQSRNPQVGAMLHLLNPSVMLTKVAALTKDEALIETVGALLLRCEAAGDPVVVVVLIASVGSVVEHILWEKPLPKRILLLWFLLLTWVKDHSWVKDHPWKLSPPQTALVVTWA